MIACDECGTIAPPDGPQEHSHVSSRHDARTCPSCVVPPEPAKVPAPSPGSARRWWEQLPREGKRERLHKGFEQWIADPVLRAHIIENVLDGKPVSPGVVPLIPAEVAYLIAGLTS